MLLYCLLSLLISKLPTKSFIEPDIVLAIIIVGIILVVIQNRRIEIKSFDASEYSHITDMFPSEDYFGPIVDVKSLLEDVEHLWIREFGDEVKQEKPYKVFYDDRSGVWLVQGTLPTSQNSDGGVANILVDNATGKVLAVWHEK